MRRKPHTHTERERGLQRCCSEARKSVCCRNLRRGASRARRRRLPEFIGRQGAKRRGHEAPPAAKKSYVRIREKEELGAAAANLELNNGPRLSLRTSVAQGYKQKVQRSGKKSVLPVSSPSAVQLSSNWFPNFRLKGFPGCFLLLFFENRSLHKRERGMKALGEHLPFRGRGSEKKSGRKEKREGETFFHSIPFLRKYP